MRVEVDAVRGLGEILALHREHRHAVTQSRVDHQLRVELTRRQVDRLHDRLAGPAVLDDPAAEVGKFGLAGSA